MLGEEVSTDFYEILNQQGSISQLNTELHPFALDYLRDHLLELLESGRAKHLSEEIFYSILASYSEKVKKSEEKVLLCS